MRLLGSGLIVRRIRFSLRSALSRSTLICKLSQNQADIPKNLPSRRAVLGVRPRLPATISLTLVDANGGAVLPGAAVYLWHCDAEGRYSWDAIARRTLELYEGLA